MTDVAHSVRDRLRGISRATGEPFADVLVRYGMERLLYRLSQSVWRGRFALKGAYLFGLWMEHPLRATRDVDLSASGRLDETELAEVFRALCAVPVEPDGLVYAADEVRTGEIRRAAVYHGVRIRLVARLRRTRIPLQVDVGLGDAVEPRAETVELPVMLPGMPHPRLRTYTRYSVVAEKLHAVVELGFDTSRMKDLFDLCELARRFPFDGDVLARSIAATFRRRKTAVPVTAPAGLSEGFAQDRGKQAMWRAFLERSVPADQFVALEEAASVIREFLAPVLSGRVAGRTWQPGQGWSAVPVRRGD